MNHSEQERLITLFSLKAIFGLYAINIVSSK